jgi:hypothetical protein
MLSIDLFGSFFVFGSSVCRYIICQLLLKDRLTLYTVSKIKAPSEVRAEEACDPEFQGVQDSLQHETNMLAEEIRRARTVPGLGCLGVILQEEKFSFKGITSDIKRYKIIEDYFANKATHYLDVQLKHLMYSWASYDSSTDTHRVAAQKLYLLRCSLMHRSILQQSDVGTMLGALAEFWNVVELLIPRQRVESLQTAKMPSGDKPLPNGFAEAVQCHYDQLFSMKGQVSRLKSIYDCQRERTEAAGSAGQAAGAGPVQAGRQPSSSSRPPPCLTAEECRQHLETGLPGLGSVDVQPHDRDREQHDAQLVAVFLGSRFLPPFSLDPSTKPDFIPPSAMTTEAGREDEDDFVEVAAEARLFRGGARDIKRFQYNSKLHSAECKSSFRRGDPLSVTNVDLLNRAFDAFSFLLNGLICQQAWVRHPDFVREVLGRYRTVETASQVGPLKLYRLSGHVATAQQPNALYDPYFLLGSLLNSSQNRYMQDVLHDLPRDAVINVYNARNLIARQNHLYQYAEVSPSNLRNVMGDMKKVVDFIQTRLGLGACADWLEYKFLVEISKLLSSTDYSRFRSRERFVFDVSWDPDQHVDKIRYFVQQLQKSTHVWSADGHEMRVLACVLSRWGPPRSVVPRVLGATSAVAAQAVGGKFAVLPVEDD